MTFDSTSRYKDRIEPSTASYHMNPYRQDPWAMKSAQTYHAMSKDRVESSQEKLERELMEKFRRSNYRLPKGSLLIMAQVGKAVMLMVVLPPYFLFYLMPIWVFRTVILPAEKLLETVNQTISKGFLRISAWSTELFQIVTTKVSKWFKRDKKRAKDQRPNLFQELGTYLKQKIDERRKVLQIGKRTVQVYAFVVQQKRKVVDKVVRTVKQLYKKTKAQVMLKWNMWKAAGKSYVTRKLLSWKVAIVTKAQPLLKAMQKVDRALQKSANAISKTVQASYNKVAEQLQPLKPLVKTLVTVAAVPFTFASRMVERSFQRISRVVEKGGLAVKSISQRIIAEVARQLISISAKVGHMFAPVAFAIKAAAWHQFQKLVKKANAIKAALQRIVRSVLDKGSEQAKKGAAFLKKCSDKIVKAAQLSLQVLIKAPSYFWSLLKALGRLFISFCKVYFKALRLLWAWTKVLTRYSLEKLAARL
jgi:hypothetical protein